MKNSLNVEITRPDQLLVIMRGIPGSGKSTESKKIAGETGIIHSTDDVIEANHNYRLFFEQMISSGDFAPLSRAHSQNLKNAIKSMNSDISPIVIDNTNIKANEAKAYVVKALELGFSDVNISILDIGTGGQDAKTLAERNTHGVPFEKIESMIQSHKSVGPLTIKKILESKDMYKQSNILYSAVVLTEGSHNSLVFNLEDEMIVGWNIFAHHMTINLGELKDKSQIGEKVILEVTHIGESDMTMAVKVNGFPSKNEIPHITIAINPDGGKPVMSNQITNWRPIKPFRIEGIVTEISKFDTK